MSADKGGQAVPGGLNYLVARFQAQEQATNRLERLGPDDHVLIDRMNVSEEAIKGIGGIDGRAAGHVVHQIDRLDPSAVRMGDTEPEARALDRRGRVASATSVVQRSCNTSTT